MSDERENLSWQRFGEASRELATVIAADGFEPDLILSTSSPRTLTSSALAVRTSAPSWCRGGPGLSGWRLA